MRQSEHGVCERGQLLCCQAGHVPWVDAVPGTVRVLAGVLSLSTVQCLCASTLFYCAHWQTYVSGTLQFGTIDVTEGQIVVMLVMLTSSFESFFNVDIWSSSVSVY